MGFRFQKHIGILPGLRANISKSGVSLSAGIKGAHITVGRTPRVTLGIPGSGLSYTETLGSHRHNQPTAPQSAQPRSGLAIFAIIVGLLVLLAVIGAGGH